MNERQERPDFITDKMLEHLDGLRESGVTNMFGSIRYIQDTFDLSREESADLVSYWQETSDLSEPGQVC